MELDNKKYRNEKNRIDQIIGKRIILARKWRNISRNSLAEKTGLEIKLLSKYEAGIKSMSADTIVKITQILGFSINQFFEPYSDRET
jgi:transcriptional regulator with XRE-family HTH domain